MWELMLIWITHMFCILNLKVLVVDPNVELSWFGFHGLSEKKENAQTVLLYLWSYSFLVLDFSYKGIFISNS